jgi:Zn-dependent alcohol dehydrogenase
VGSIAALDTDDAKRTITKQLGADAAFNARPADIAETARLLLGGAFCRGVRHRQEQWNHAGEASW